jgi:N-acetyl-anhydromuramyl-L-alanine amidase AmpD
VKKGTKVAYLTQSPWRLISQRKGDSIFYQKGWGVSRMILEAMMIMGLLTGPIQPAAKNPEPRVISNPLPLEFSRPRNTKITHIMIHYISNASMNPRSPYEIKDVLSIFKQYGVSAHYLINREGDILQLVPENRIAFHAGKGSLPHFPQYTNKLNDYSIGIELLAIGTENEMLPIMCKDQYSMVNPSLIGFTSGQYNSLNTLLKDILYRNHSVINDRKHVIGHDEYAPNRKFDPGSLFSWSKITVLK